MIFARLMDGGLPRGWSGPGRQRAAQPESALAPVYPNSALPGLQGVFVNFPMPPSDAVCGLPGALSTIVNVPVLVPIPTGPEGHIHCFVNFPTPVSDAVCGLPGALSTIVNVPVLVWSAVGWKVTLIVQKAPAATGLTQLLVCA